MSKVDYQKLQKLEEIWLCIYTQPLLETADMHRPNSWSFHNLVDMLHADGQSVAAPAAPTAVGCQCHQITLLVYDYCHVITRDTPTTEHDITCHRLLALVCLSSDVV